MKTQNPHYREKEPWFNIPGRRAFVNITPQVERCLLESGVSEGLLLCNAMHCRSRSSASEAAFDVVWTPSILHNPFVADLSS
jgi:thiamine phosphate synthase YjbQ (UPF0047 family)